MNDIFIQIATTIGGIFAGLFMLAKYFLKHLEIKNGTIERIAKDFNTTISNHLHDDVQVKQKMVDSHRALIKAIDRLVDKK